jgi:hypothetical protein
MPTRTKKTHKGDRATPLDCPFEKEQKDEQKRTQEIIDVIHQYIEARFQEGRRPALRDAHAKDTGLVKAWFEVDPQLDATYQKGVFAAPPRRYKAWIRFSNGNCEPRSDRLCDARGMAIKLTGVPGKKIFDDEDHTQDFILINSPSFFGDDLQRYKATLEAFLTPWIIPQWLSILKLRRWKDIKLAFKANISIIQNPLYCQYWSTTPYKLGDKLAIKFTAKPRIRQPNLLMRLPTILEPGFSLKRQMERVLSSEKHFDFYIQLYKNKESTPIEDTTVEWKESVSELIHVATITIPPNQKLSSAERDAFCENLSFSPWHCLPEHKPLGAINRVRRIAYKKNSEHRHELNRVHRREPTDADWLAL